MVLPDHRMPVDVARAFNSPIIRIFLFKTAGIADEIAHLAVFVLAGGNPVNFIPVHPHHYFTAAGGAVAVGVHGI